MSTKSDGWFRAAPALAALFSAMALVFVVTYAAEASVTHEAAIADDCFTCLAEGDAGCGAGEHRDYMGASFFQGEFHGGCNYGQTEEGICGIHAWCNVSLNLVKDVSRLIATRDVDAVMERISSEPLLSFDEVDATVQVHTCDGVEVMVRIPLSTSNERLNELMNLSTVR
jgi:uncharacterized membrane protein